MMTWMVIHGKTKTEAVISIQKKKGLLLPPILLARSRYAPKRAQTNTSFGTDGMEWPFIIFNHLPNHTDEPTLARALDECYQQAPPLCVYARIIKFVGLAVLATIFTVKAYLDSRAGIQRHKQSTNNNIKEHAQENMRLSSLLHVYSQEVINTNKDTLQSCKYTP